MGDEEAVDVAGDFFASARDFLAGKQVEEVKTIGDAMMIRAEGAAEGVRLGLRLVHDVGTRHRFCSLDCVRAFAADPSRFTGAA